MFLLKYWLLAKSRSRLSVPPSQAFSTSPSMAFEVTFPDSTLRPVARILLAVLVARTLGLSATLSMTVKRTDLYNYGVINLISWTLPRGFMKGTMV